MHSHFMPGDCQSALETGKGDFGYGTASSMPMLDGVDEAVAC
jgi:hypothetical protein